MSLSKKPTKLVLSSMLVISFLLSSWTAVLAMTPPLPNALKTTNPNVKLTLLEFSAPWCVSCQMLKPELKKLQQEAGSSLNIVDINIEKPTSQKYIQTYEVYATPTLILFDRSGKAIQKFENDTNPAVLHKMILKQLGETNHQNTKR